MGIDDRFWEPLTAEEAAFAAGRPVRIERAHRRWLFAVAICRAGEERVAVKRQPAMGRDDEDVLWQHRLTNHLADRGVPAARARGLRRRGDLLYELFDVAAGEDAYAGVDSWEPFRTLADARAAGATLARLHAAGGDYMPRRPQPQRGFVVQLGTVPLGPAAAVEALAAARPAVAAYLAERDWRDAVAAAYGEPFARLAPLLPRLPARPLHGDWQTNNLFFGGGRVSGIIDFHQADYGPRALDLAVAVERNAFFWNAISAGDDDAWSAEHARAIAAAYAGVTPLEPAEREAFADVLAVCQFEYGISFLDYYWGVERDREKADWAWETFVIGHARWWQGAAGRRARAAVEAIVREG